MSDINNSMLTGNLCKSCYKFMGEPCGYPRKCKDCIDKGLTYETLFKSVYDYAFKNRRKIVKEFNDNIYELSYYILLDYSEEGKYHKSVTPVIAQRVEEKLFENNAISIIW